MSQTIEIVDHAVGEDEEGPYRLRRHGPQCLLGRRLPSCSHGAGRLRWEVTKLLHPELLHVLVVVCVQVIDLNEGHLLNTPHFALGQLERRVEDLHVRHLGHRA